MDISIIIVNYNSGDFLYSCIKSILEHINNINYEIIVVDNYSTDKSLDICNDIRDTHVRFIKLQENLGFSKANNIGMQHSRGTVLHFLNPDTRVDSELNKDYEHILNEVNAGLEFIYSNKMLNRDGSYTVKNTMPFPLSKIRERLNVYKESDYFCSGATIILSKHLMKKLGGWNEAMFMYYEDTDLSYKAHKMGITIKLMPAIIYHYGGGSSERSFTNLSYEIIMQKSMRTFYKVNKISLVTYWMTILVYCMELILYKKTHNLPIFIKGIIKSF